MTWPWEVVCLNSRIKQWQGHFQWFKFVFSLSQLMSFQFSSAISNLIGIYCLLCNRHYANAEKTKMETYRRGGARLEQLRPEGGGEGWSRTACPLWVQCACSGLDSEVCRAQVLLSTVAHCVLWVLALGWQEWENQGTTQACFWPCIAGTAPGSHSDLKHQQRNWLKSGVVYPIMDGIPDRMPQAARTAHQNKE